jgi:hypothetical protein
MRKTRHHTGRADGGWTINRAPMTPYFALLLLNARLHNSGRTQNRQSRAFAVTCMNRAGQRRCRNASTRKPSTYHNIGNSGRDYRTISLHQPGASDSQGVRTPKVLTIQHAPVDARSRFRARQRHREAFKPGYSHDDTTTAV